MMTILSNMRLEFKAQLIGSELRSAQPPQSRQPDITFMLIGAMMPTSRCLRPGPIMPVGAVVRAASGSMFSRMVKYQNDDTL